MVFLIIFGTRGVTSTVKRGEFSCPRCEAKEAFVHKRVRRFFTLYFLPVIPLDVLGEYVECQRCHGTFEPAVLTSGEGDLEAIFQAAIRRVMVLMMVADGRVDPAEIETIQEVVGKLTGKAVTRADIDAELAAARADGRSLHAYLASMSGRLNDAGKELVVNAAFLVASADGSVSDEESQLLAELATALEMSPAHFRGVVDNLRAVAERAANEPNQP